MELKQIVKSFWMQISDWGKEDGKRFVLHHSILSEGINVPGLEAALFMRMNSTAISQTLEVLRVGD